MVFRTEEITELIGEYVAAIAHVTLIGCAANALMRDITDDEEQQIMRDIEAASDSFVTAYKRKVARKGNTISKASADALKGKLSEQLMLDCWAFMQKVTEELKKQTEYNDNEQIRKN